ncbi:hypothetical protein PybrP1_003520 [[Pythium] brassicae (nom. inval.)]|nr:hypothetical protein PybrP1_003520 [[Pythium] brassicae (nom. inval.)]
METAERRTRREAPQHSLARRTLAPALLLVAITAAAALTATQAAFQLHAVAGSATGAFHSSAASTSDVLPGRAPHMRGFDELAVLAPLSDANETATATAGAQYNETAALYLAHVTSVAYCQAAHIHDWSCQPCGLVPRLERVQIVMDKKDSFQGLVGYSAADNAVVVAFRGSMDVTNWIDNMTFIKKRAYAAYPSVKVHQGFYWVYRSVAAQLVPLVRELVAAYPGARVLVTGHSLGAAVAAICTFELALLEKIPVAALYTFGAPRAGNAEFSAALRNASLDVFRVTHFRDVVPHLPPTWIGFQHTTREVFYDEFQSDYRLCSEDSGEDMACSNACSPFGCTSVVDHLTYLNVTMSHLIC